MLYIQSNVNQLLKSWNLNILLLSYFLAYEIYSILKLKKKKKINYCSNFSYCLCQFR